MEDEDAVLLTDALSTGYFGAQLGDIVEGDVVVVFGAGPVGLFAAKSAWLMGAGRVIVIDHLENRLEKARTFAHPEKPPIPETADQLRARIPGWGADLDPADRPAVPKQQWQDDFSGAHWEFPERQPEQWPRERSIEHAFLTPVFGTSCPPKGLSGVLRKAAYRRYSEARAAHWLILIAADRVDAWESHLRSFATLHPDNPITETGVLSEFRRHGIASRLGQKRADVLHQALDPVIVAGPWVAAGYVGLRAWRRLRRG